MPNAIRGEKVGKGLVPDQWVVEELATARLGDKRLLKRAQILMSQFARQPSASIPQACERWSDVKAAYRFFDNDQVDAQELMGAHHAATCGRMQAHAVVLAVQDTTTLNYSTHPQTEGLGPVSNNADKTLGLLLHSTLALSTSGVPLGLLDAQVRSRSRSSFGSSRDAQKRNRAKLVEKESQRWLDSLSACQRAASACPQTRIVNITDREGDIYELFESALQNPSVHLLVRAQHNRHVQDPAQQLWEYLESQSIATRIEVKLPRQPGLKEQTAVLKVQFGNPMLCAPLLKEHKPALRLSAIQARQENAPAGQVPILWRLLTTLPVTNAAEAAEKIQWYCQRWQIEVLHKVLKSGCKIEQRQLETTTRLKRALMFDLIVAWRMMLLSKVSRQNPAASATEWLLKTEWQVLWCYMKRQPPPDCAPNLRQAVHWIGQLGGFLGRKSDGEPGPIVLWRGLTRLHDLSRTFALIQDVGNA
jgi:hypothetical protein